MMPKPLLDFIRRTVADGIQQRFHLPDMAILSASPNTQLTLDKLKDAMRAFNDEQEAYTREVWRDLSTKWGPRILMTCTPNTLATLEQTLSLDPSVRPAWVKTSVYLPVGPNEMVFLRCACICHEPQGLGTRGQRVLMGNGNWCCTCSTYEDVE